MRNIYNLLHSNEKIKEGVIEVINFYDYNYWLIVLDGKVIDDYYTDDYESILLSEEFLEELFSKTKVEPEKIVFVEYDFENFARKFIDYDCNDFGYKEMYNLVEENLNSVEKIDEKIIARGLDLGYKLN